MNPPPPPHLFCFLIKVDLDFTAWQVKKTSKQRKLFGANVLNEMKAAQLFKRKQQYKSIRYKSEGSIMISPVSTLLLLIMAFEHCPDGFNSVSKLSYFRQNVAR